MSTFTKPQKFLALSFLLLALIVAARPLQAQYVTTTIASGTRPIATAVNPVTNKVYVANYDSNDVTVVDGATGSTTTIIAGTRPCAVAVNPSTNKIYVANNLSNNVTVIDGATNLTVTLPAGTFPIAVAVNPVTNRIYVANASANVTVIDGATNRRTTVPVESPSDVAVNPVTNKIYVANGFSNNVVVIDGATNTTTSVSAGTDARALAVNPVTNKIYVANESSSNITVIDGGTNSYVTVGVGTMPVAVAVHPVTNEIYVANFGDNTVTVINGATNFPTTYSVGTKPIAVAVNPVDNNIYVANYDSANVTVIDGASKGKKNLPVGTNPYALAVDPVTNKIYVANRGSADVTVIDGAMYLITQVSAGSYPYAAAVNPRTNKIYVTDDQANTVTVIDGTNNTTSTIALDARTGNPKGVAVNPVTNKVYVLCQGGLWAGVTVIDGTSNSAVFLYMNTTPESLDINPVTDKIYVSAYDASSNGSLIVIDGTTNSTLTVAIGRSPGQVAVNPLTNRIYVANGGSNTVTMIDGATNSPTTIIAGTTPLAVAVNPVTNKIYVANRDSNTVTIIDGATNSTVTVGVGTTPRDVAVNPVTNKIYVTNCPGNPSTFYICGRSDPGSVIVIDGGTNIPVEFTAPFLYPLTVTVNPVTNKVYVSDQSAVLVIDGASNAVYGFGVSNPYKTALNPITNTTYIPSNNRVLVVKEQRVRPIIPLKTVITPFGWATTTVERAPIFRFTATSSFRPTSPPPQAVWYQVDTWQGTWLRARGTPPSFTGAPANLSLGKHILYAFATDGQDATSTMGSSGIGAGTSPLIGSIAAYLFDVIQANSDTALSSDNNPSSLGQVVTFSATVTATSPATGTPGGVVTFYDGSTTIGTAAIDSSGKAAYATSSLAVGSHSITATYSGDANFFGSTSPVLTQQVNGPPVTLSPASVSFGNVVINTTSAARTVTLANNGAGSLSISSIAISGSFTISAKTCGMTLAAGAKCRVNVTFAPTVLGPLTGALTFTDNAPDSPQAVPLSGTGVFPATLMPATATYAAQVVGTTSLAKTFTLSNYQTVALTSIGISTTGDFAVSTTTCATSLAAKAKCTISVTFTPTATGQRTGQLSVSDSANNSPQTVPLSGTGVLPATLTPATATYAAQTVGTTSPAKTFTLTNNQTVALTSIGISTTGDFAVSATSCMTSLTAKSKCTISVTFTPTAVGTRTGKLRVSDSASNSPQTASLTGTGR